MVEPHDRLSVACENRSRCEYAALCSHSLTGQLNGAVSAPSSGLESSPLCRGN
jgi:hypothetical protein